MIGAECERCGAQPLADAVEVPRYGLYWRGLGQGTLNMSVRVTHPLPPTMSQFEPKPITVPSRVV